MKLCCFIDLPYLLDTGGGVVGSVMAHHMDIAKISFTGSGTTGRRIQAAATASNLKRVTLELGGKSPAIVFEDADLNTALFWSIIGITVNSVSQNITCQKARHSSGLGINSLIDHVLGPSLRRHLTPLRS